MPEEALKQFKDTEDWRKANKLDELYDTIDIDEYESSRRLVRDPIMDFTVSSTLTIHIVPAMDWPER